MIPKLLPASPDTHADAKAQARRLAKALAGRLDLKHGQALELIAKVHGQASWGHLSAALDARLTPAMTFPETACDGDAEGVLAGGETLNHLLHRVRVWLPGNADAATDVLSAVFRGLEPKSVVPEMNAADLRTRMQMTFFGSKVAPGAADALIRDVLSALTRVPCRDHPREVEMGIQEAVLRMCGNAVSRTLADARHLFDGLHSILFGDRTDRVRAEALRRGLAFWDLSGTEFDLAPIAAAISVKMPQVSFRDPMDGLQWILGHADHAAPLRHVVVLPLGRRAAGVDVMLALARSLGLHICLRPDRDILDRHAEEISSGFWGAWILSDADLVLRNH